MIFDYIQTTAEQKRTFWILRVKSVRRSCFLQVPSWTAPHLPQRCGKSSFDTGLYAGANGGMGVSHRDQSFWRRPWVIMMPGSAFHFHAGSMGPNVFSWAEQGTKAIRGQRAAQWQDVCLLSDRAGLRL